MKYKVWTRLRVIELSRVNVMTVSADASLQIYHSTRPD
jgi:hypothetical protein